MPGEKNFAPLRGNGASFIRIECADRLLFFTDVFVWSYYILISIPQRVAVSILSFGCFIPKDVIEIWNLCLVCMCRLEGAGEGGAWWEISLTEVDFRLQKFPGSMGIFQRHRLWYMLIFSFSPFLLSPSFHPLPRSIPKDLEDLGIYHFWVIIIVVRMLCTQTSI